MVQLALVLYMHALLPVTPADPGGWDAGWAYRLQLADAIVTVTDVPGEQLVLARIARFESSYREDVGHCVVNGKAHDHGPWQVVPRSDAELVQVCASLVDSARLALARVHESTTACRHLPASERLAVYARGRCDSAEGRALSRHRWPSAASVASYETALQADTAGKRIDGTASSSTRAGD